MTQSVDLQEFIKQSILDILSGVASAKKEFHNDGNCVVAPGKIEGKLAENMEQLIEFEIETISIKTSDGKIKISVLSGELSASSQARQKIKFNVPVLMRGLKSSNTSTT